MGSTNTGDQRISWKYETPLKGAELALGTPWQGLPGLVTRPKIASNGTVTPFSAWVTPISSSHFPEVADEDGKYMRQGIVKVTFTSAFQINGNITANTCAVGLKFDFTPQGTSQADTGQQYADVEYLNIGQAENYTGIIIATVTHTDVGHVFSTNGADLSTELLIREGFDPLCWASVESPRRSAANRHTDGDNFPDYGWIEYRTNNNLVSHKTSSMKTGIIDFPEKFVNIADIASTSGYVALGLSEEGIRAGFSSDPADIKIGYADTLIKVNPSMAKNTVEIAPLSPRSFPASMTISYNETKKFVVFSY